MHAVNIADHHEQENNSMSDTPRPGNVEQVWPCSVCGQSIEWYPPTRDDSPPDRCEGCDTAIVAAYEAGLRAASS